MGEYEERRDKKARVQSMLKALLDDPILSDVPKNPTLYDVDTLIGLELGSAMRISIIKLDATSFGKQLHHSLASKLFCKLQIQFLTHSLVFVFVVVVKDVTVMNSATVKDLKLAIKKKVNDMEQSNMGHRQISWLVAISPFLMFDLTAIVHL